MAGATPNPFRIGHNHGPSLSIPVSAQHGAAEQWAGTVFANVNNPMGITPPASPRRTTRTIPRSPSPRQRSRFDDDDDDHRDRERESRRRTPFFNAENHHPDGLGARLLVVENRIRELAATFVETKGVIETVNTRADTKIEEMRVFFSNVEGRFQQIERAFPERFHNVESRQAGFVETINALTKHLQEKFQEIEELIKARPSGPPVPPSFGGPRASNGEFYIGSATGSPLSGPPVQNVAAAPSLDPWANFANSRTSYSSGGLNSTSTPTAAPTLGSVMDPPPGMASTPVTHKPWDSKLWSTNEKVSKELKPFDGSHGKYKIWASRLKDHFIKRNPDWQFLFTEIESHKFPITKDNLKLGFLKTEQYTIDIDFAWTATTLWTFIGEHVVDSLYNIRNVLAGGHNNGLELWRALFVKHEGGADQVELSGMGSLHSFPPCEKVDQLQFWVGKWQEMKDMYGAGISDAHLRSMFINILPESVRKDIREKPGLTTLQQCIDHVLADIGRLNDVQLSKMHSDRLKQSLSSTQRISPVLDKEEHIEKTADVPKPEEQFQTLINALSNKMENLVAAIARPNARPGPKRAPSQFAKYGDKCLHCGSGDHRALECPVKKALLAKNGGTFPPGYKSAFDKWKEEQPKPIAPIIDAENLDDDEYSETDLLPVWCVPQCAIRCQECADPPSFTHPNAFSKIFDAECYDDNDDDETKILDAIQQFSSKITIGPKISQKERKSQRSIEKCTVAQIAKLVRSGKLNLPELDLDHDEGYEAVWALVDSGAARSCARRRTHFAHTSTQLKPSSVRMATASGEELKSRGCFRLEAVSTEGNKVVQTFEDADVDMPIMSVGELSSNGELGSNVLFGEHDGHIIDIKTSATSKFHRRRGVYFMKIYVPKNKSIDPDFIRPGTA